MRPRGVAVDVSERSAAEDLLGADHPLVRVLAGEETVRAQLVSVTAVQGAGAVWLLGHWSFGWSLALAAAVVQIGLGCRLALLRGATREACLDMIVAGEATLPLRCIERLRRRLLEHGTLDLLASSVDEMLALPARPGALARTSRPLVHPRVIRAAAPELRQVASLLRADPALRGVAQVEWVLTSPATPLYGNEAEPLLRELRRAIYLLTLDAAVGADRTEPAPAVSSRVERKGAISRQDDLAGRDL